MKVLKLDRAKILRELRNRKKSAKWLAKQIGCSPQALHYGLSSGSTKKVGEIADVLGITPKLLLKTVTRDNWEEE